MDDPWRHGHDADKIREHVLQEYIEPARKEGKLRVEVRVGDVQSRVHVGLANIVGSLNTQTFMKLAGTTSTVIQDGFGVNRILTFKLSDKT